MTPPASLPARLYLLGYDPRRQRINGGTYHGLAIRAAALEELRQRGSLVDDDGKVQVAQRQRLDDPILDAVLTEVSGSAKPRSWQRWISANVRTTYRAVRDQLDDRLYIRLEPYRVLGLFPAHRVRLRDTAAVRTLQAEFERDLTGDTVPAPAGAALVALAAVGEVGTVAPRQARRQYRDRISQLSTGPLPEALRKAVQAQKAAAAASG
jgi:hypothetical protein